MFFFHIQDNQCLDRQKQATQAARDWYWDWLLFFFLEGKSGRRVSLSSKTDKGTTSFANKTMQLDGSGAVKTVETDANVNDQMVGFDLRCFFLNQGNTLYGLPRSHHLPAYISSVRIRIYCPLLLL